MQPQKQLDGRRFPRAVRPDQPEDGSLWNSQVHTVQSDILVAVDLGQIMGFDNIHLVGVYPNHLLRRL